MPLNIREYNEIGKKVRRTNPASNKMHLKTVICAAKSGKLLRDNRSESSKFELIRENRAHGTSNAG